MYGMPIIIIQNIRRARKYTKYFDQWEGLTSYRMDDDTIAGYYILQLHNNL